LALLPRLAGVIAAEGALAGFTAFADWRDPAVEPPKGRDFAHGLGPLVVTRDELGPERLRAVVRVDGGGRIRGEFPGFDWDAARDFASDGTALRPGDLIAGPALGIVEGIAPGSSIELEIEGIGILDSTVAGD
jgi:2-keto-4-pentenoate hydratase/2-oxohepta-3-ene-1,7-dioic acid hydratase in catechol pathway